MGAEVTVGQFGAHVLKGGSELEDGVPCFYQLLLLFLCPGLGAGFTLVRVLE